MAPPSRRPVGAAAVAAARRKGKKDAGSLIYVVDASLSGSPFPVDSSPSPSSSSSFPSSGSDVGPASCGSGFDVSRQAVVAGILDVMKNHKSVEVEVVVCQAPSAEARRRTTGDGDEDGRRGGRGRPWWRAHLKRLGCDDHDEDEEEATDAPLQPATSRLLHRVRMAKGCPARNAGTAAPIPKCHGTVLHGLYWAVQLLWDRHAADQAPGGGATNDRIVLVMDGKRSELGWPRDRMPELQQMMGQLAELGCEVRVAWMEAATAATSAGRDEEMEEAEDVDHMAGENIGNDDGGGDDDDDEEEDDLYEWTSRRDRIQFLSGIVDKSPSSKLAEVRTLQQVLDVAQLTVFTVPKANKTKVDLVIASDLIIQATQSPLVVKKSLPTVRSDRVALADDDGNLSVDSTGEPLADTVYREKIRHVDGEVAEPDDIVRVVPFLGELVPVSRFDYLQASQSEEALFLAKPRYELLGFLPEWHIPRAYLRGPPKVVSGDAAEAGARTLVAALAQSLQEKGMVGICTVSPKASAARSKLAPMILGALYPMTGQCLADEPTPNAESASTSPSLPEQLVFLQLPFEGEVLEPAGCPDDAQLPPDVDGRQAKACDDLIDAMKLGPGVLDPWTVPSPALRAWNQTILQRFLSADKDAPTRVAGVRGPRCEDDPLRCPRSAGTTAALDQFWQTFQLPTVDNKRKADGREGKKGEKGKKGKRALYYKDWL